MAALDQADLSFSDFMLVIANVVIAGLVAASIEVPGTELDLVKSWFTQELLTETHRKELLGSLETEASASVGIALLAKLTAKGTAVFKSHNEYRQEIRRRAERDPSELIRRVNLLLDAGTRAVSQGEVPRAYPDDRGGQPREARQEGAGRCSGAPARRRAAPSPGAPGAVL